MEFSDCVVDRRHHSSRESISKNPSLNLTPIIERFKSKVCPTKSDSCRSLLRGDWHFFDEKNVAYQPELLTSDSCFEVFLDNQLSNSSLVTGGSAYNCHEILEETQCSIHSETISKPSVPKLHFESSRGISIIL